MYVTVWTSSGAIKVALPNNALISDLKQVLVDNLYYVPDKLEISYGGRYVRDDVYVARFPPDTLVAEGPRYDPRRLQQLRQMELQKKQQEEMLRQQQLQKEAAAKQAAEAERRRRLQQQQQQQFVDPLSALFGFPSSRAGNNYQESDDDDDTANAQQQNTDEEDTTDYGFMDPFGFGGLFGAPRPRSRATRQKEQHRAEQLARQKQQQELLKRQQEQQRKKEEQDRLQALKKLEEQRAKLRQQQEEMRRQQEELARQERDLLVKMEEEARLLKEKEAAEAQEHLEAAKAKHLKTAKAKKKKQQHADEVKEDETKSQQSQSQESLQQEEKKAMDNDNDNPQLAPMSRQESAVIVTPHLQRVGLDEAFHRPQEEQPSPATSASSTPRNAPKPIDVEENDEKEDEDAEGNDDDNAVTESSKEETETETATPQSDAKVASSETTPASPAEDEAEKEKKPANLITIKAHFPELEGKSVEVQVPADALVSDVIAKLKEAEPEVTKQGVRIMFFEKYVRKESEEIRAVPLTDGCTIDVCTGKFLSENEMTLYLANRHRMMVKAAIEAHQGPIPSTLKAYWNEQLMKALMQLDSLQEVPEDIRLRRKAAVKEVMAQQDALAEM